MIFQRQGIESVSLYIQHMQTFQMEIYRKGSRKIFTSLSITERRVVSDSQIITVALLV
jgi:hypothetical protein